MSLPGDKKRLYTVILFDAADNEVRRFEHVLVWNRREAYYEMMRTCSHRWWDAVNEEEGTNATQ